MILDSSILIADERGRFALQEFFAAHGSDTFQLAAITVSELWQPKRISSCVGSPIGRRVALSSADPYAIDRQEYRGQRTRILLYRVRERPVPRRPLVRVGGDAIEVGGRTRMHSSAAPPQPKRQS